MSFNLIDGIRVFTFRVKYASKDLKKNEVQNPNK